MANTAKSAARKRKTVHCFDCDQACCRTAVIEVDAPRSLRDYSDLLFYLHHDDTQVVVAMNGRRREWYVEFLSRCRYLGTDGRCAIYERRPLVCREYDMSYCERNTVHPFAHLRSPEDFYTFLRDQGRARILDRLLHTHVRPSPAGDSRRRSRNRS